MKARQALFLSRSDSSQSGFTLVEVLVATGILVVVAGIFMTSYFQIRDFYKRWRDQVEATRDLRHATSVFGTDALITASTTLVSLAPATSTVAFEWTDGTGTTTKAVYSLSGTSSPYSLLREHYVNGVDQGDLEIVRGNAVTVEFSLSGKVVTLDLEVLGAGGETKTTTVETHMRYLK